MVMVSAERIDLNKSIVYGCQTKNPHCGAGTGISYPARVEDRQVPMFP